MSEFFSSVLPLVAAAVAAISLLFSALVGLRCRRALHQQRAEIEQLQREVRTFAVASAGVGSHVTQLERRQRQLAERQDQHSVLEPGAESYQHAIRLAHRGAGTAELMDVCGLNQGEAELIALVHRMKKAG